MDCVPTVGDDLSSASVYAAASAAPSRKATRMDEDHYPTPLVVPVDRGPRPLGVANGDLWAARFAYAHAFAWAIPSEKALAAIVALSPIVEVGAGGGYWAQLLRERGADVLAFDLQPDPAHNHHVDRRWGTVHEAPATVAGEHPDRTLLLIWPPLHEPMAHDALQSYRGDRLVYIGDGFEGVTADDDFFELLDEWELIQTVDLPNWDHRHDDLGVYRRRG